MSETQRQNDYQYTPVTLTNFDVDASGLIFTVAKSSTYEDLEGKVRALNAAGKDVFGKEAFGDWEWDREDSNTGTQYIDVTVQEDGYFGLLDATRKRIFVYTPDCELLAVFGAQGELVGTFVNPVALESDGENIWVVDAGKNTIQVFAPTAYVRCMKKAASEMKHGDYQAALSTWQSALTYNTNSRMAHIGIGNCYDYLGDYEAAMQAYKNGYAHDEYSVSFKEWRKEAMRANFIWVLLAVAAVLAAVISLIVLMGRMLRQVEGMPYCRLETRRRLFLYTLLHPSAGFEQLRPRGFASPGNIPADRCGMACGCDFAVLLCRVFIQYEPRGGFSDRLQPASNRWPLFHICTGEFRIFQLYDGKREIQ